MCRRGNGGVLIRAPVHPRGGNNGPFLLVPNAKLARVVPPAERPLENHGRRVAAGNTQRSDRVGNVVKVQAIPAGARRH
eukprot:3179136-Prymnesium_polylepis.1